MYEVILLVDMGEGEAKWMKKKKKERKKRKSQSKKTSASWHGGSRDDQEIVEVCPPAACSGYE
jgi:hypothetical protein